MQDCGSGWSASGQGSMLGFFLNTVMNFPVPSNSDEFF
jgi:hypothetical protein